MNDDDDDDDDDDDNDDDDDGDRSWKIQDRSGRREPNRQGGGSIIVRAAGGQRSWRNQL